MVNIIQSWLTGAGRRYKHKCVINGTISTNAENKVVLTLNYSVQAIDKITGQECPVRPYDDSETISVFLPDTENDIDIVIDSKNKANVTVV